MPKTTKEKFLCSKHHKEKAVYASAKTEKAEYFCTDCFTEGG